MVLSEFEKALVESYDAVAEAYADGFTADLASKVLDRAMLTAFAEHVRPGPVADVGCGPGQVAAYLLERGVHTIGVDLSPGMVEVARARNRGLEVHLASMLELPFEQEHLAGLVAFYSLIHLPAAKRAEAYAEFFRVVRQGGWVLVAFHAGDEVRHLDSWLDRPVSVDFYALQAHEVADGLRTAGFVLDATLIRGPYPGEVDTDRAYLLARKG